MSKFLDDFREFLKNQPFEIIRISESANGNEPETEEYTPVSFCQNVYSVAKTFTMTALGLLYDKGLLSPDEKVCDILSDEIPASGMDERWYNTTIDLALRHRAGLPGGFLDIDCARSTDFTDDFLKYMLTYPLAYEPDTESRYSDGAFYLLARIGEKKAGMPLDNFLWKEMFTKLEFQEMAWSHCPKGHVIGATGLYIHSSDMVKLGMVYLSGGLYKDKRILSEEWVKMAMDREYGLDWDESHTICAKGGMFGQRLMIVPGQNRAVAVQSYGGNSGVIADWVKDYKEN